MRENSQEDLPKRDIISRRTSEPERGLFIYNPPINFLITRKPIFFPCKIIEMKLFTGFISSQRKLSEDISRRRRGLLRSHVAPREVKKPIKSLEMGRL